MINKFSPILLIAVIAVGCAKKESYDEVYKEAEVMKKSQVFSESSEIQGLDARMAKSLKGMSKKYLYVPMTLGTPREVAEANPFYQGDTKLVRMKFSEAGIEVLEIEKDERFAANDLNSTPVLTIPGDHLDFQCKEDANGDCSNAEEVDEDKTWDQKAYFKPNYSELEVKEVNMLDLVNVEGSECVVPNGVRVVDYEVKKDSVINIELEKTYKLKKSWECIRNNYYNDKFSYNSFKVRFFYSLVALDELATKGYEPLEYDLKDHDVYGYFKSESKKLNDDFDSQRTEKKYLANRWDPNKKVLDYYLSSSYSKPQNRHILNATMRSMVVMNKNLASAGANFRLNFIEQSIENEKSPGDLRYNSIVLIDDPLANGLLGYAPSVKNPETGEIIQSHINMYGGVLTSGTRWIYGHAVDLMEQQKQGKVQTDTSITVAQNIISSDIMPSALALNNITTNSSGSFNVGKIASPLQRSLVIRSTQNQSTPSFQAGQDARAAEYSRSKLKMNFKRQFDELMSGTTPVRNELDKMAKLQQAERNGHKYHSENAPEFFPIAGTTKAVYPGLLKIKNILDAKTGILKRWDRLTKSQKNEVKKVIIVNRYTSTFVHEMGHSLGLRHNFAGSTDAANFYTDQQAASILGDTGAKAPAYTSVMDYAFSEYNQLTSFGSYDVAALKFSYSGKMQTKNGAGVTLPKGQELKEFRTEYNKQVNDIFMKQVSELGVTEKDPDKAYSIIQQASNDPQYANIRDGLLQILSISDSKIVDFKYCTDENAGLSSMCNRFDEGTTLVEIANHKIERYESWYKYRNFRDGRNSFSSYGMMNYLSGRYNEFYGIRDIVEDYEVYAQFFSKEFMANGCSEAQTEANAVCKDINDRRDSLLIVGKFFLKVLKTPELTCAIAKQDDDKKVIEYKTLLSIYDRIKYGIDKHMITSCFDDEVTKHLAENPLLNEKGEIKKDDNGETILDPLVVVGENGKFLNDIKDTNPEYKYASDRSIRGIWADKIVAMRMLYERSNRLSTTDTNHMALIDHPEIKAEVENLIKHLVLGKPLNNPIPFKMKDGTEFVAPYVLSKTYKIDQIEDAFSGIKSFIGLPSNGPGSLTKALLSQITKTDLSFDQEMEQLVYETNNYVTVRKHRLYDDLNLDNGDLKSIAIGRFNYVAGPENVIAYSIANLQEDKDRLDKVDKKTIEEVYKRRAILIIPADLTVEELAFWNIDEGMQAAIINLAAEEGDALPIDAFVNAFGNETGPILHSLYLKSKEDLGVSLKELVATKVANTAMMTTVPADATDEVKALFTENLELLKDYIDGRVTDEVIKFYKKQLVLLPRHVDTLSM